MPSPSYEEKQTERPPHLFACAVTLPNYPLSPFGIDSELYSSKTLAKKAAARQAVLWLRDQGRLVPDATNIGDAGASKRQKQDVSAPAAEPGTTGLTQVLHDVDVNAASKKSLPQQVYELVASLGFSQPAFETRPSKSFGQPGAFVDMAARFQGRDVQREPRLAGSVGKVERVFGKKQAREMCCRELLRGLEEIRRSRGT